MLYSNISKLFKYIIRFTGSRMCGIGIKKINIDIYIHNFGLIYYHTIDKFIIPR